MTAKNTGLSRPGIVKCLFVFILFFLASGATSCSYLYNTNLLATLEKQVTVEWIYTPSATPTLTPTPTTTPTPTPTPTPMGSGTGRLAFSDDSFGSGTAYIYSVNIDGTGLTQLTTTGYDWDPAWSPDGRRIVFISKRAFDPQNPKKIVNDEIYVMDADGSNQTRLSSCLASCWSPVWSPDGKHIVYNSNLSGHWEIYVMNSDGSGQTRLIFSVGNGSFGPSWSPDGTQIAYAASTYGGNELQIFVMNADGSNRIQLTNNPGWNYSPSWSPDGRRIAYFYANKKWTEVDIWDIFVMNADGSGQTRLTHASKTNIGISGIGCELPNWSPDGTYISFICGSGYTFWGTIHIMNVADSGQLNIDTKILASKNYGARWQP